MPARFLSVPAWILLGISAIAQPFDRTYQNALRLFEERELTAARTGFIHSLENPANALKSRYYLGRIALLESKPADAIQWLDPIAFHEPPILDSAAQLGRAYLDSGQIEKAKSVTERALSQSEWDGALHYRLARIYQQLGDSARAQKEFAESVRLKSADREFVKLIVECSQKLSAGAMQEALAIRRELLDNRSLDPDVLVALGLTFTGAGLPEESLELFEVAAKRDPGFFQAQYNAGLALLKLKRPAEATAFLEAAQRLTGDLADSASALSLAYILQARYADAISPLEKWKELQPTNARALNLLGLAYLRTNSGARAVATLKEAVRLNRSDAKPYFLLIEALNATEQQTAALDVADGAVKLFPALSQAYLAKAQQLARLGRYQDAGPPFEKASELAPGQIDPLLGLAEVQQKKGDYRSSLETDQRVLAIDPTNITASLGAARSMILAKDVSGARSVLEAALATNRDNAQLHYELSRVYARLGEATLAAEQTRILQELRLRENRVP